MSCILWYIFSPWLAPRGHFTFLVAGRNQKTWPLLASPTHSSI